MPQPKRTRRWLPLLMVALGAPLAWVATATGTNWGSQCCVGVSNTIPDNGVWFTFDASWGLARRDLSTVVFNAVGFNGINNYGPTDLNPTYYTPAACDSGAYDVCIFDSPYGDTGFNGFNQCVPGYQSQAHPNQVCFRDYVKINITYATYDAYARSIVCHEFGHSVGVRHTGTVPNCHTQPQNASSIPTNIGTHEVGLINGRY